MTTVGDKTKPGKEKQPGVKEKVKSVVHEILREQIHGGQPWRNPNLQRAWLEEEKKKKDEKKRQDEEKKRKAEIDATLARMVREELLETGRLKGISDADARLEKLRADVAELEAKAKGVSDARERQSREVEERGKQAAIEAATVVIKTVEEKEKELEAKKKEFEDAQKSLVEARRRELLEYKAFLGLPPDPTPFDLYRARQRSQPTRAPLPKPTPVSVEIYDDPRFWELPEADQRLLEGMTAKEQAQFGFGPLSGRAAAATTPSKAARVRFGPRPSFLSASTAPLLDVRSSHVAEDAQDRSAEPQFNPADLRRRGLFLCLSEGLPPTYRIVQEFGPVETSFIIPRVPAPEEMTTREDKLAVHDTILHYNAHATSDLIEVVDRLGGNAILRLAHEVEEAEDPEKMVISAYGFGYVLAPVPARTRHGSTPAPPRAADPQNGWGQASTTNGDWYDSNATKTSGGGWGAEPSTAARDAWGDPIAPSTLKAGGWGRSHLNEVDEVLRDHLKNRNDRWGSKVPHASPSAEDGGGWGTWGDAQGGSGRGDTGGLGWDGARGGSGWGSGGGGGWGSQADKAGGWGATATYAGGEEWGSIPNPRHRSTAGWGSSRPRDDSGWGAETARPSEWKGQQGGGSGGQPWGAFLQMLAAEKLRLQAIEKEVEVKKQLAKENGKGKETSNREGKGKSADDFATKGP